MIDDVEVKRVRDLSPRDIEHDNSSSAAGRDRRVHAPDLRREIAEETVTVVRFSQIIETPRRAVRQRRDAVSELRGAPGTWDRACRSSRRVPDHPGCSSRPRGRLGDDPRSEGTGHGSGGVEIGVGWIPVMRTASGRLAPHLALEAAHDLVATGTQAVSKPHLIEARADGELTGSGRWRLFEQGEVTAVVYEWNVATIRRRG